MCSSVGGVFLLSIQPPNPPKDQYVPPAATYLPPINHRARLSGPGIGLVIAGILSGLASFSFAIWAIFLMVAAQSVSQVTANIDDLDVKQEMSDQELEMINEMG